MGVAPPEALAVESWQADPDLVGTKRPLIECGREVPKAAENRFARLQAQEFRVEFTGSQLELLVIKQVLEGLISLFEVL